MNLSVYDLLIKLDTPNPTFPQGGRSIISGHYDKTIVKGKVGIGVLQQEKIKQSKIMYTDYQKHLSTVLNEIKEAGLYKNERIIVSPQGAEIELSTGQKVLNFCAK